MSHIAHDYPGQRLNQDESGFRRHVEVLIRGWLPILGLTLLTAIVTFALVSSMPDSYSAEADVALLDSRTSVVFDENYTTLPSEETAPARSQDRPKALRALATSKSLLAQVFEKVSPQLPAEERDFDRFQRVAKVTSDGDLLRLEVAWSDPRIAAMMVNEWAQIFTTAANQSYVATASRTPDDALASASSAFAQYQTAQRELEGFIKTNNLSVVQREVGEIGVLIADLQNQRTQVLRLANSTPVTASLQLADATRDIMLNDINTSIRKRDEDRVRQLTDQYERKANLEQLDRQLTDLETQLANGNIGSAAASGDALAVLFSRAGLFEKDGTQPAISPDLQLNIDLAQFAAIGEELTGNDITELLVIVRDGLGKSNLEIERLTKELFDGTGYSLPITVPEDHVLAETIRKQTATILDQDLALATDAEELKAKPLSQALTTLSDRRQVLLAQIESQEAQQRELARNRDSAWESYTTLANKAREVEAQIATGAPQARIAVEAFPPATPDSRSRLMLILIAGLLGMGIGVVYTLGRELWQSSRTSTLPGRNQQASAGVGD